MATRKYDPPRQETPKKTKDPLEIELVYNVRPCGTCSFFWPDKPADQPYGPFPSYDFDSNTPKGNEPKKPGQEQYEWMNVTTRKESFPNGEVMDGCRKAPIMTIGINPNLTAFSPGITGTSWAYPDFSSSGKTDAWTKYAYYYRYRSVYQECFDFDTIKNYILDDGKIVATADGEIVSATRTSSAPDYEMTIKYKGHKKEKVIKLDRLEGEPRYVLLFDRIPPKNKFKKGDVIAAKLNVPAGEKLPLYQKLQTYYEQFVPTLQNFENFLHKKGHKDLKLEMGEDVCQLDMVACASPHWNPSYLGGTDTNEGQIIENCVSKNAWAMKQFVQTRPAILFLVGESSYSMFRKAFGKLIKRTPPLSGTPWDGAFTLFSETTDPKRPCTFEFSTTIGGKKYSINTRLVVTPHFSYDENFLPQFRFSKKTLAAMEAKDPAGVKFLMGDKRIDYKEASWGFDALLIKVPEDAPAIRKQLKDKYPATWRALSRNYYDPHATMTSILQDLYKGGQIGYTAGSKEGDGYLTRNDGACQFCVNKHWEFPLGCPYDKDREKQPPADFLSKVAIEIAEKGKP